MPPRSITPHANAEPLLPLLNTSTDPPSPAEHAPVRSSITNSCRDIISQTPLRNSVTESSVDFRQTPFRDSFMEPGRNMMSEITLHDARVEASFDRPQSQCHVSRTTHRGKRDMEDVIEAEHAEEVPRELSRNSPTTVEMSLEGGDLLVKLDGSTVTLKIQYGGLDTVRIFTSGLEGSLPMTIQKPGSHNTFFFKRSTGNTQTFDFFGLPGEIRNMIHELVFNDPRSQRDHPFRFKRPQPCPKFYGRLNKIATRGSGLPFVNRLALSESIYFFLRDRSFILEGGKEAMAFMHSIGPHGRAIITGPITFSLHHWDDDMASQAAWGRMIAECGDLRVLVMIIEGPVRERTTDPIRNLMVNGKGKFPKLKQLSLTGTTDQEITGEVQKDLMSWFKTQSGGDEQKKLIIGKINWMFRGRERRR